MHKVKLIVTIIFILLLPAILLSKPNYIITLNGGTKVKTESYIDNGDTIKVYKFGGYIVYPKKNIKNIQKIASDTKYIDSNPTLPIDDNTTQSAPAPTASKKDKKTDKKSVKQDENEICNPIVKNFEALHLHNKTNKNFDLKISGRIDNNCPNFVRQIKLSTTFFDENNKSLFVKVIDIQDISPYSNSDFEKTFPQDDLSKIKYFNYKLEFLKD